MSQFSKLNLCPELQFTLTQMGYTSATPIQTQAIPLILSGQDLVAEAQTGTGKTAAFALPMIERLKQPVITEGYHAIRGLVLTPTRELAIQVGDKTLAYGQHLGMRVISIYGGVRFDNQLRKMKCGADILVATPGRLLDMLKQGKLSLAQLEILVLDEADRMLDLGFIDAIRQLMSFMPKQRQTLLFSATLDASVDALSEALLQAPVHISTTERNSAAKSVQQRAFAVDNQDKSDVLSYLIAGCNWSQTLVFTRTRKRADLVAAYLNQEQISAVAIHGEKLQRERNAALTAFTQNEVRVLVATDVAARGLDIASLPQVVNYDLPNQPEAYVHRIGRTGRAGKSGLAISLVAPDERRYLDAISSLIGKPILVEAVPMISQGKLQQGRKATAQTHKPGKSGNKRSTPSKKAMKSSPSKQPAGKSVRPTPSSSKAEPSAKDKAGRGSLFGR
ncbi:DEAD/DEAH box helicase [Nitrincola iocasae]|uniref:DEAD/DEAH box helicase n=1 Tax=Nitrincola iocasae TaxID=2614693 RepID=A0A5J6LE56_9GAMM|nr:DEAD/DEAH box helicase [Nitrincola iocasae]QEW06723.1 DEAD/DEAH box helicase [Nitrincola iocasae]